MDEYGARSVDDFCQRVGIGKTLFYREVKEGRLKAVKVAGRTIVRDIDAQTWLDSLPPVDTTLPRSGKKRGRKPKQQALRVHG